MNSAESQAILRDTQREAIRNAKLNWGDITANKDFFFVADLMAYKCDDTIKFERHFDRKMVSLFEMYFEGEEEEESNRKLKIAEQVLGWSNPKYQKLTEMNAEEHDLFINEDECDKCGSSATAGLIDDKFWCIECRECDDE